MKRKILILGFIFSVFFISGNNSNIFANTNATFVAKDYLLPSAPTNFSVNRTTDNWNSITFNWTAATDATSYKICWQRKTDGVTVPFSGTADSYGSKIVTGNATTTITLTNANLELPMDFNLYVVAINDTGTSLPSNVVLYDSPPATPSNFTVTQLTSTSVQLNWDAAVARDEVLGYFIYDNNNPASFVAVTSTAPTVTLNGLKAGSTHSFAVEAFDTYGNSSFTAFDGDIYCQPYFYDFPRDYSYITNVKIGTSSNSSVYNAKNYNDYSQDFSKNDFEIYKNSIKNVMSVTIAPTDSSIGNGSDSNLNTTVYAYIDYNQNGIFETSELVNFGSMSVKPRSINVPLTFVSNPFITPSTSLTGNTTVRIIVQRNNSSSPTINPCAIVGTGEVEDYLMYIGSGWNRMSEPKLTKPSNKATITLSGGKASEVQSIDDVVKIYPNPVLGDIMNITSIDNNTPYRIINTLGQEVGSGKINNGTISVAKLSQGTYIIELIQNENRIVKQFIKK